MKKMDIKLKLLYEREVDELRGLLMDAIRYLQEPHRIEEMKGYSSLLYQRMEFSRSACCGFRKDLAKKQIDEEVSEEQVVRPEEVELCKMEAGMVLSDQVKLVRRPEDESIKVRWRDNITENSKVLSDQVKLVRRPEDENGYKAIAEIELEFSAGQFVLKAQTCFGKLNFWKNANDNIDWLFSQMQAELTNLEKLCGLDNNPILVVRSYINGAQGVKQEEAKADLARFAWSLGSIDNYHGKDIKIAWINFREDNYIINKQIYKYVKDAYEESRKRK